MLNFQKKYKQTSNLLELAAVGELITAYLVHIYFSDFEIYGTKGWTSGSKQIRKIEVCEFLFSRTTGVDYNKSES